MSNPVAGIDIVARLDGFRRQLEEIPDIGGKEARALTRELSKEIRGLERAAKQGGAAGRGAQKDWQGMGDAAGRAGGSAAKLAGILDQLAPGLGEVARVGNDAADAIEVGASSMSSMGPAAAAVVVAVGAAAATYGVLTMELEQAEERMARSAERAEMLEGFTRDLDQAERALAVATGEMSEAEASALDVRDRWTSSSAQVLDAVEAQRKAIEEELRPGVIRTMVAFVGLEDRLDSLAATVAEHVGWMAPLAKLWDNDRQESEALRGELAQLDLVVERVNQAAERGTEIETAAIEVKGRSASASRAAADAEREREAALRAAEAAAREVLDATTAYEGALDRLAQAQQRALQDHLSVDQAMVQSRDQALAEVAAAEQAAVEASGYAADRAVEIETSAAAARTAIWDDYYLDLEAKRQADATAAAEIAARMVEDARRAQMELAATTLGGVQTAADLVAGGVGAAYQVAADNATELVARQDQLEEHLTAAQRKALAERVDAAKAAARAAFNNYKAAQLAQAFVGMASAFVAGLDDAPFPANLVVAGLSAAAAIPQIATIASTQPAFHDGGEVQARLLPGEWVNSRQGRSVLGDETLRRADAGMAPQSQELVLVTVYEHTRQSRRYKRDGLLRNDPVQQAINAGRLLGQRAVER